MKRKELASLKIWNNKIYMFPVMSFLDSILSQHRDMDMTRYHCLRFVVGEVLKRRINKAYPDKQGEIYVDLFLTDTYFEVSVRDKGVPSWWGKDEAETSKLMGAGSVRSFAENLVDEIGLEKLGMDGQRIYVRQRIKNPLTFKKPEPYKEIEALDTNISILPVKTEEDVIEAIRCIYSEYGYSYSYDRLYYVDSFMRLVQEGSIMSFLAVNDHGQTAGHFALAFSEQYKDMPEISTVVIRKEFRGLGLFSKFMQHCEEVGKAKGFRALMGQPVAFHPMSQKAFLRADYIATSLLLSYLGTDIESEYNQGERLSLCASVKMLDEKAYSKIYPPEELKELITNMYDKLGMQYDIASSDGCADDAQLSIETNEPLKMTKILLQAADSEVEKTLRTVIQSAIKQKIEMLELVILLNAPSCAHAYEAAKACGFFLSGVIPGGANGDYLIMQMLPGDEPDYDSLVLVGEFEELRNTILAVTAMQEGETKQ